MKGHTIQLKLFGAAIIYVIIFLASCNIVSPNAILVVDHDDIVYYQSVTKTTNGVINIHLSNTGSRSTEFYVTFNADWIVVMPNSGKINPGQEISLLLYIKPCTKEGSNTDNLKVIYNNDTINIKLTRICISTNNPPTVGLSADPVSGTAPLTVTFTPNASDPDGDSVSCSLDYGDGSDVASVTCSGNVTHTYQEPGTFQATLTAVDGKGGSAQAVQQITATESQTTENQNAEIENYDVQPRTIASGESVTYSWQELVIQKEIPSSAA